MCDPVLESWAEDMWEAVASWTGQALAWDWCCTPYWESNVILKNELGVQWNFM